MVEITVDGETLRLSGTSINFPEEIGDVIKYPKMVVVRLKYVGNNHKYMDNNVLAINLDGSIKWVIEKAPEPGVSGVQKQYTSIRKNGDELWTYNANGFDYQVDKTDGTIIDREFRR